jgi:hypothetical protein
MKTGYKDVHGDQGVPSHHLRRDVGVIRSSSTEKYGPLLGRILMSIWLLILPIMRTDSSSDLMTHLRFGQSSEIMEEAIHV